MKLAQFLHQAASVLRRLDAWLPPEAIAPDWQASIAYRWTKAGNAGVLQGLPRSPALPP